MKSNQYEIDLSSIWRHEREIFLFNGGSKVLGENLLDNFEFVIKNFDQPAFCLGNDNETYYNFQKKLYDEARHSATELFRHEFFFYNDNGYSYDSNIVVKNDYENFHYWFALKLRQFQKNIFDIDNFLHFQLELNFENSLQTFMHFLILLCRQYENGLLNKSITLTVTEWMNKQPNKQIIKNSQTSFFLANPNLLYIQNKNFLMLFRELQEKYFISEKTAFSDFKKIFTGNNIAKDERIIWTGNYVDLQWFIKSLYSHKIVIEPKNKWLTAINCFTTNTKTGFTVNQLRNAKDLKDEKKIQLDSALSKLLTRKDK